MNYNEKTEYRERFHRALTEGICHAVAVLKEAKPDITPLEYGACLVEEFDEFTKDFDNTLERTIRTLSDAEIKAIGNGINGVLGIEEERELTEDEETFSYDNYMKHVTVPGGVTCIDRLDPTVYMAEADVDAALSFLQKVIKVVPGGDTVPQSKWQEIKETLKAQPGVRTMEWHETCSAKGTTVISPGVEVTITDDRPKRGPSRYVTHLDDMMVTTLVDRGVAISSDGTRTYIDLETGSLPGTVAEKTAMQNTTVIADPDAKPVWWRTDDGERAGYFAPYIPLTKTRAWADDKLEEPRVIMPVLRNVDRSVTIDDLFNSNRPAVLPDTDSLHATLGLSGFYCPEVPLTSTGTVIDPETFEPVTYDRWGYAMDDKAPTVNVKDTMDAAQFKAFGEAVQRGVEKTKLEPPTRKIGKRWTVELDPASYEAAHGINVEEELEAILIEEIAKETKKLRQEEILADAVTPPSSIFRRVMPTHIVDDIVGVSPMCAPKVPIAELRRRYAHPHEFSINDLIGVQPMTGPTAQVHTLRVRHGLDSLTADPNVKAALAPDGVEAKTRRFSPRQWGFMDDTTQVDAARADHVHPEPLEPKVFVAGLGLGPRLTASDIMKTDVVLTESNAPVHPLQCSNRSQREKSSIEVASVSFR